jgi:hypothetical protein
MNDTTAPKGIADPAMTSPEARDNLSNPVMTARKVSVTYGDK